MLLIPLAQCIESVLSALPTTYSLYRNQECYISKFQDFKFECENLKIFATSKLARLAKCHFCIKIYFICIKIYKITNFVAHSKSRSFGLSRICCSSYFSSCKLLALNWRTTFKGAPISALSLQGVSGVSKCNSKINLSKCECVSPLQEYKN